MINSYASAQSIRTMGSTPTIIANRSCFQTFTSNRGQRLCHECPNEFSNLDSASVETLESSLEEAFKNGFSCSQIYSVLGMPLALSSSDLSDDGDNYALAVQLATENIFGRSSSASHSVSQALTNSIVEALRFRYSSGRCTEPTPPTMTFNRNRRSRPEAPPSINCTSQRWDLSVGEFRRIRTHIDSLELIEKTPGGNRQTQQAIRSIKASYVHDLTEICLSVTHWRQQCEQEDSQTTDLQRLRATQNARLNACLCAHLQSSKKDSSSEWNLLNIEPFGGTIPHPINARPLSCSYYLNMPPLPQSENPTGHDESSSDSSAKSAL